MNRRFWRGVGISAIWGVLLVGAATVIRWIWAFIAGLHLGPQAFAAAGASIGAFFHDQAAIWVTAIATVLLFRATNALSRATNIEQTSSGPFLELTVGVDDQQFIGQSDVTYYYDNEDLHDANLAPFLLAPRYVRLQVANVQTSPHGVAGNVLISLSLLFGSPDDVQPHPHLLERTVPAWAIGPNRYSAGPIFNVGTLPNFGVIITKVVYRDILNVERSAAFGTGMFVVQTTGNVITIPTIFEPKKGEYTSAYPR